MLKKENLSSLLLFLLVILEALLILLIVLNNKPKELQFERIGVRGITNSVEDKSYDLSLFTVGDALIHNSVYKDAYTSGTYDFSDMLENIKPAASAADLSFYNQETILGGIDLGLSSYPRFNSPVEVGDSFRYAGFNLVSLANNHTLDKGEAAITNSIAYWEKTEAITAGSYTSSESRNEAKVYTKNDITFAFLAYTDLTNGIKVPSGKDYLVAIYDEEVVKADIKKVRDKVDVVMVSMHFGSEYTHTPTTRQKQIANYLASQDVDIVIGHHPHVIQPVEYIDDTLVIYSLGNFLSGQVKINQKVGMAVLLTINKTVKAGVSEVRIKDVKADLHYTYSKSNTNYQVIPFTIMTNDKLSNYNSVYEQYKKIIDNDNVTIGNVF